MRGGGGGGGDIDLCEFEDFPWNSKLVSFGLQEVWISIRKCQSVD